MNFFNSIPSPTVSSFELGPVTIHFYALFILAGIVVATIVTAGRMKARGMESGLAIDIAIWAVPFGIIGGRLFHVFTHVNDYFGPGKDWTSMFKLWEGGLAIYGALIFGTLGAYIACQVDIKKLRITSAGIRFLSFADALVPGLLAAQALGRWGNFFNTELFGEPTDLPWGLEIPWANPNYPNGLPEGVLFHPTFLYESLWSLLGIGVLLLLESRFNLRWGRMFAAYLIWYSFGRFFIEGIRLDPSDVFLGLRTNQWSAVIGFLIGLALLRIQYSKHTGAEESGYLPGRSAKPQPVKTPKKPAAEVESKESSDQE
jgi:prolipoprotein diacylglyceryl transferase